MLRKIELKFSKRTIKNTSSNSGLYKKYIWIGEWPVSLRTFLQTFVFARLWKPKKDMRISSPGSIHHLSDLSSCFFWELCSFEGMWGSVLWVCRLLISTKSVLLHCHIAKCVQLGIRCLLDGTETKLLAAFWHYPVHTTMAVEVWGTFLHHRRFPVGIDGFGIVGRMYLFWNKTSFTKCSLLVLRLPCHSLFPWNRTFSFSLFLITEKCFRFLP